MNQSSDLGPESHSFSFPRPRLIIHASEWDVFVADLAAAAAICPSTFPDNFEDESLTSNVEATEELYLITDDGNAFV